MVLIHDGDIKFIKWCPEVSDLLQNDHFSYFKDCVQNSLACDDVHANMPFNVLLFLAHRIRISEILPWDRKDFLSQGKISDILIRCARKMFVNGAVGSTDK